jgi:hypothetical protein
MAKNTPAEPTAEELAAQLAADAAPVAAAGTRYRVKSSRFHGFQPGDEVTLESVTPEQLQHLEAL